MYKINLLFALCALSIPLLGQVSTIDSLRTEITNSDYDTTKISLLIDLAYELNDSSSLDVAREAFQLGKNVTFPKYRGRSEAVYGLFLSSYNLDSGLFYITQGANRYLENDLTSRAANAFYIKGILQEVNELTDEAVRSYEKTVEISEANDHFKELGDAAYALANIYNIRGRNVEALELALKAKDAFQNGEFTREIGQTLNQIGIIYDQKGLYSEALENYLQARDIAIQTKDINGEILINNNMGVIYDNMNDSDKALQYYGDALEKARINGLEDSEATLLNNLSYIHLKNGDTSQAISLLKRSLDIDLSEIYPCFESYPLEGLGSIFIAQGKVDSAEYLLKKSLERGIKCEDVAVLSSVYKDLGMLYAKIGQNNKAKEAFRKALDVSSTSNLIVETKEILYELYKFYKKNNNTTLAMDYLESYQTLVDSIYEAKNVEKATQLAAEYDFRKQVAEMENERLQSEQKLAQEIEAKKSENRLILLALVLFFLLAISLGRSYYVIQKRNKKLRWLNDEKNKLMGIVAHDLRNPLNMIIGLIPLFKDHLSQNKDPHLEKYVELMEASSERMRDMIDRVLDISAIENMKVNLKLEKTDLTTLTYESIHNFDVIAAQKKIKIVDDIDKSEERFSVVDPNYLVQVIDNLLSNAIKFSDKGKQIEVSLISENEHYEIKVKDEGPGIPEKDQKNLFKAYTTLSSKPTGQERSTGLGLSIAYKFIKAMGGEIKVDSTPGEGTSFNLRFKKA
ncbi:tetratricopeptide repeat-containing sensor histidine kinase [Ekhidna sp.]|uniref:tetratricopeptide repeat-containing sensor histidine kinase n=1 Tax=Ekhidna sp. TaxID=2608089 RepID=UPI003CCC24A4